MFVFGATAPVGQGLYINEVSRSQQRITVGKTPHGRIISSSQRPLPDKAQHSQQTPIPPVGFEPTISAGERPQTYALDRAVTGICHNKVRHITFTRHSWYCCTQLHTQSLNPERDRVRPFSFSILRKSEKFVAG